MNLEAGGVYHNVFGEFSLKLADFNIFKRHNKYKQETNKQSNKTERKHNCATGRIGDTASLHTHIHISILSQKLFGFGSIFAGAHVLPPTWHASASAHSSSNNTNSLVGIANYLPLVAVKSPLLPVQKKVLFLHSQPFSFSIYIWNKNVCGVRMKKHIHDLFRLRSSTPRWHGTRTTGHLLAPHFN